MQIGVGNVIHTILDTERNAFTNHVNETLQHDQDLKNRIPISSKDIFDAVQDGVILCKLINAAVPGKVPPISPQAINHNCTNPYQKIQNINLAIQSAKSIGCTVVNIRAQFIIEKRQHIVLGLIWQIIRIHLSNQITLKRHPEIIILKKEDEQPQMMQRMGYEQILLRWLNYHIKKDNGTLVVKNFGKDLSNSQAYGHVFHNISQNHFKKQFWEYDQKKRANQVIDMCHKENIKTSVTGNDIVSGNPRLNLLLCATIFNQKHGLKITEQKKIIELPPQPQTDQTRQMRIFKNWINSQGIEDVYVNYLIDDLRNGRILLKVIDRLKPDTVDWKGRYSDKLHSRIHIVQNCNYVLEICKDKFQLKIIDIGGVDIVDGKITLTLGLVWQLCKLYWSERVGKVTEEELVNWGNSLVPNQLRIKNFKDKSLSNCMYFLKILESISSKSVDYSKVKEGNTEEQLLSKINYTISIARRIGAEVIMLWEHVKEVNSRYIFTFMAQLNRVSKTYKSK